MKTSAITYGECGCCGARINLATSREAEMTINGLWYQPGTVPDGEESQGRFDLGAACYRRNVKTPRRGRTQEGT
jgi:hypothetical protein